MGGQQRSVSRILVTGASGLLGLNLCMEAAAEHEVVGVVHSRALAGVPFETRRVNLLDARAAKTLLDEAEADWLVHCAALADLDACERQPELAQKLNTEVPGMLAAEAARRSMRMVHISTDAVFDGEEGDYAEEDRTNPLSLYARTKLAGEQAVQAAHPAAIIVRTVFFGWSLSGRRSLAEIFYKKLSSSERMPGHTDRIFSPLLVNRLAGILLSMLGKDLHGLFHAASADHISKADFGLAIAERFGLDGNLIQPIRSADAGLQAARAPRLSLRSEKLAAALGEEIPNVSSGIEGFYELHRRGYPQTLRVLAAENAPAN